MRLIDADELKKNFQDELCKGIACAECSMQVEGFCRAERWIDIAPTIAAEPIKHGKPVVYYHGENTFSYECSICRMPIDKKDYYCRWCGAIIDGENNE